jgi:23S rRNA pseudouridine2605 synthase
MAHDDSESFDSIDPVASARRSHRPPKDFVAGAILNKPPGFVSTRKEANPRNRPSVYACLPKGWDTPERPLGHCGRLDLESSGLLLFTDDGLLQQALLNSAFKHVASGDAELTPVKKVYHVKTPGKVDSLVLAALMEPLLMGGHQAKKIVETAPAHVVVLEQGETGTWLEFTIREGRNRQIRRLCGRSRLPVDVLRRVQFGPLILGDLAEGQSRCLTQEEINTCYAEALPGVKVPTLVGL